MSDSTLTPSSSPSSLLEKLSKISSVLSGGYVLILLIIMLVGWGVHAEIHLDRLDWQQQETIKQQSLNQARQDVEELAIQQINVHLANIEGDIKALVVERRYSPRNAWDDHAVRSHEEATP